MPYTWQVEKRNRTRQKIIEVSLQLFREKGYHNTQVMEIVTKAGVSAGTLYKYFKDKRDLFYSAIQDLLATLREELRNIRKVTSSSTIPELIKEVRTSFLVFFKFVDENPDLFISIIKSGYGVDEEIDQLIDTLFNDFAKDIEADIENAVTFGIFEKDFKKFEISQSIVGMAIRLGEKMLTDKEQKITYKSAADLLFKFTIGGFLPFLGDIVKDNFSFEDINNLINEILKSDE